MTRPGRLPLKGLATSLLVVMFIIARSASVPTQVPPPVPFGIMAIGAADAASHATDLAEFGEVIVGQAQTSSGAARAFALREGRLQDLGTLGGPQSIALGVSAGIVVGHAQTPAGHWHAFMTNLWDPAGAPMLDLGTLGGTSSAAHAAEYTSIVGEAKVSGDTRTAAFLYEDGTMRPLPIDLGGDSAAYDILYGQVVGYACTSGNASCRPFWLKDGVVTMLPTPAGRSWATAINGREQIVGVAPLGGAGTKLAFLYADGVMTNLGTLGGTASEALDINERGDIVGTSDTPSGPRAFGWRDGVMTDLNTLLPSGSGWVLERATGITEAGQISGIGTLDGITRGFLLTPPADVAIYDYGQRSSSTSNLPRGVEVGRTIRFVNSVVAAPEGITLYGVRLTATLEGPAEYVAPARSYDGSVTDCEVAAKTITCDVPPVETVAFGQEYRFSVRVTGPGDVTHRAHVSSVVPDPVESNNTVAELNRAVALQDLALTPASIAGGKASSARLTLTGLAPYSNDATVRLTSSRPDIAAVPATFVVPHDRTARAFNIIPAVVSEPTPVEISASYGLVTVRRTLMVMPPVLSELYLTPTTVTGGCGTSTGKVVLTGAAPAAGAVVALSNTNDMADVPASVTVPAGASSGTFSVTTRTLTTNARGTVTATYGGMSRAVTLTVRPIRVKSLVLSPDPVTGGATTTAIVVLECAAPAAGTVLRLSSSNAAAAWPAVTTLTIPAGATTGSFVVRTSRPTANTSVNIYATAYGVRKSAALTVEP